MIITCPWNKLCSIGTKVWELWTSDLIVVDGGAGVDDEGLSSALALFLDAICNEKNSKFTLDQIYSSLKAEIKG